MKKQSKGLAVITGASSGIGAVYADRLAHRGYDLLLVARNQERMADLAKKILRDKGSKVETLAADLTDSSDLGRLERILREDSRITLLVNNAGVGAAAPLLNSAVTDMSLATSVQQKRRTTMTQKEIHFRQTTTVTPEQYIAGLTDFGPGRSKLFGNSADEYLKVHHRSRSEADVTEGSGGIWERLHYDWSDPNRVVLTTIDSNMWGGASGHTYTFTRQPNGTTDIDVVAVREGKNFKGRLLGFALRTIGRSVLEKAFQNSIKAIKARNANAGGFAELRTGCSSL